MMMHTLHASCQTRESPFPDKNPSGFSLVEFLLASLITLVLACAAFELLSGVTRSALWQADTQEVLDNVRGAMDAAVRHVRHAANDPIGTGFEGITIVSPTEVRLRSDFTGSEGAAEPDKGDADGDTDDAAEDVRIRYNPGDRSVEVIPQGGSPQVVAANISAFDMRLVDEEGNETAASAATKAVRISITGDSSVSNPFGNQPFRIQIVGYVRLATRR